MGTQTHTRTRSGVRGCSGLWRKQSGVNNLWVTSVASLHGTVRHHLSEKVTFKSRAEIERD